MFFVEISSYLERVPCVRALSTVPLSIVARATPGRPFSFLHMLAHLTRNNMRAKNETKNKTKQTRLETHSELHRVRGAPFREMAAPPPMITLSNQM